MKYILLQILHVGIPAVKIRKPMQLVYSISLFLQNELAMIRNWHDELSWSVLETDCVRAKVNNDGWEGNNQTLKLQLQIRHEGPPALKYI